MSPDAILILSLLAMAVAVTLAASMTLKTVLPPPLRLESEGLATIERGVPVQVVCPRTTIPTRVELARRPAPQTGLVVLSCAEFDGVPTCDQACVSMPVPLVSA